MRFEVAARCADRFVKWSPGDDRRVVEIAQDDFAPFALVVGNGLWLTKVETPIGKLSPGQIAEAIGPVVKALFKNFWCRRAPLKPTASARSISALSSASLGAVQMPSG